MAGYVAAGWGAAVAIIGLYALRVVRRGRALSRTLPDGEATWR